MTANVTLETCTALTSPGRDCYCLTAISLGLKQLLFPVCLLTETIQSAASTCRVHPLPQGDQSSVLGVKQLNRRNELWKRGRGVWGVAQGHGELLREGAAPQAVQSKSKCLWPVTWTRCAGPAISLAQPSSSMGRRACGSSASKEDVPYFPACLSI